MSIPTDTPPPTPTPAPAGAGTATPSGMMRAVVQHAYGPPDVLRTAEIAVPTIADADGDGTLDIVVALKDSGNETQQALVFAVPGSSDNCLAWPSGRGNLRRDGYLPPPWTCAVGAP